jgi:hypothetical protein
MCHGYEMKWWKSENAAKTTSRQAKPNVVQTKQDEQPEAVPNDKVGKKELIPAE